MAILVLALASSPACAQRVGFHFGGLVSSMHGDWQKARFGSFAGASFDVRDSFRVGVLYVLKGTDCCPVHSVEVPLGVEMHRSGSRAVDLEVSYTHGLLRDYVSFEDGSDKGHRVIRVGLGVS